MYAFPGFTVRWQSNVLHVASMCSDTDVDKLLDVRGLDGLDWQVAHFTSTNRSVRPAVQLLCRQSANSLGIFALLRNRCEIIYVTRWKVLYAAPS